MHKAYKMTALRAVYRSDSFEEADKVAEMPHLEEEYNEQGLLVREVHYDQEGEPETITAYSYNEKGQRVSRDHQDMSGEFSERLEYTYNDQGKMASMRKFYIDGTFDQYEYKYDAEGNETEIIITDEEGMPAGKTLRTFQGRFLQSERIYDDEGAEVRKTVLETDAGGRLIRSETWSEEGYQRQEIVYNEAGEAIRKDFYDEDDDLTDSWELLGDNEPGTKRYSEGVDDRKVVYSLQIDAEGKERYRRADDTEGNLLLEVHRDYDSEGRLLTQTLHATGYPFQTPQYLRYIYKYT